MVMRSVSQDSTIRATAKVSPGTPEREQIDKVLGTPEVRVGKNRQLVVQMKDKVTGRRERIISSTFKKKDPELA